MASLPVILSCTTFGMLFGVVYLRGAATRAGLKPVKDPGMVLVSLPAIVAVTGIAKANLWASLFGLLLAVFSVACHARRFIGVGKPR
jgi:hypothetical protein